MVWQVCACLYPWCLDKAVQEGLTWAVLETNPDKPSMSHKGDKTLVLSTLYFLLSTQRKTTPQPTLHTPQTSQLMDSTCLSNVCGSFRLVCGG